MNRDTEVLVALSGGMDSAAVVLQLREAGYRPRALFMDMLDSETARRRARTVAEAVGLDRLLVENCAERFRHQIIDHTLAEHAAGRTPSPCARCNAQIKWQLLVEVADRLGIFHIATGHYVRREEHNGRFYFGRGVDPIKDQSYYLWEVPESSIRRAILPLGESAKGHVRQDLRERYGLTALVEQPESMGLCFLGGISYREFLRSRLPVDTISPGDIVDREGRIVGRHDGYPLYTAGQKRDLTLFDPPKPGENWAVMAIDAARNRLIVAPSETLYCREITLTDWRATLPEALFTDPETLQLAVRGLGRNPKTGCRIERLPSGDLRATLLHDEAWAITPGQPAVFYRNGLLLGGGILTDCRYE